jgi:hypothetical protein
MILDQALMFADAQAITATAAGANDIDLGPLTGGAGVNPVRDIGTGEPLWVFVSIGAQDIAPAAATITLSLSTDDNTAFSTPVSLGNIVLVPANAKAGGLYVGRINPAPFERYVRATLTVANGPITQGAVSAGIIWNEQSWRAYASGFTTGIFGAQGA